MINIYQCITVENAIVLGLKSPATRLFRRPAVVGVFHQQLIYFMFFIVGENTNNGFGGK